MLRLGIVNPCYENIKPLLNNITSVCSYNIVNIFLRSQKEMDIINENKMIFQTIFTVVKNCHAEPNMGF